MGSSSNVLRRPLLTELAGLGWTVIDQVCSIIPQDPARSLRTNFRDLILPQVYNKLSYDEWPLIMMQEE